MLVCDHRFRAVLLRQSAGRERNILEIEKNRRIQSNERYNYLCVYVCVYARARV